MWGKFLWEFRNEQEDGGNSHFHRLGSSANKISVPLIQLGEELQPPAGPQCKYLDHVEMFNPRANKKKILEKGIFFLHPCEYPGIRKGRAPIFSWRCRAGSVPLPHCRNYFLNPIIPEIIIPKSTFFNRKEIFGLFPREVVSCRIFSRLGPIMESWRWEKISRSINSNLPPNSH